MKKFIYSFFLIALLLFISFIIYISILGVETSKFNNIITQEIKKKDPNIQLSLDKIKIKFDIKKIQIYISTFEPQIIYKDIRIPIKKINLYSKISSILKSKNEINQATVLIENFNIEDIQKLAVRIKPSNFKTYLLNNLYNGEIEKILIDVKLGQNFKINDYKVNGSLKKVNVKAFNDLLIQDVSLNFISDKNLTLINSISANYQGITISNGSTSFNKNKKINIEGKFDSQFNFSSDVENKLFAKSNINFLKENKVNIQGSLLHKFSLTIDENFKLNNYEYYSKGNISESQIILKDKFKAVYLKKPINKISIYKTNLEINLNNNKNSSLTADGFYNLGGQKNKKFKVTHDLSKKNPKYFIDFDLSENIFLELINFKTNFRNNSNIKSEINYINNNLIFKYINFTEGKNSISINNLKLNKKNEIESVSKISVLTFRNNKENNNFKITSKKKSLL